MSGVLWGLYSGFIGKSVISGFVEVYIRLPKLLHGSHGVFLGLGLRKSSGALMFRT